MYPIVGYSYDPWQATKLLEGKVGRSSSPILQSGITGKCNVFKYTGTRGSLCSTNAGKPPYAEAKLAAMAPGTLQKDLLSMNKRLASYVRTKHYKKTMALFEQMLQDGMNPDTYSFVSVVTACSRLGALEEGQQIHSQIARRGYESDVYVGNSLVDLYVRCGSIEEARSVFSRMSIHNLASWNIIILGHVKYGQEQKALELFQQMQRQGLDPDPFTFVGVLNACATVLALEEGRSIHSQIIQRGCESNVFVASSLVDMYAKCGCIDDAWGVFEKMPNRNEVTWNAMILGYVKCGQGLKALELSRKMAGEGLKPNRVTLLGLLNACASIAALEEGRRVHKHVVQAGYEGNIFVGSSLVDMYCKCGSMGDAWGVFSKMPKRNAVAWNAMILGYVRSGQGRDALNLYQQMQQEGMDSDPVTFVAVLNACASLGALKEGTHVHEQIVQSGHKPNVFVGNSLIDMYAKCGNIQDAWRVFSKMPIRNVVSWSTMIGGFAIHGHDEEAVALFHQMRQEGVKMNGSTLVSLLAACSHAGRVDEGMHHFESMSVVYSISPTLQHLACLADLLGRAGHLHEAEDVIKTMSFVPSTALWRSLLAACKAHNHVEMAERVAKQLLELNPDDAGGYVLQSTS